jgi:anti-sigma factor ChrR (cupin superfamily)
LAGGTYLLNPEGFRHAPYSRTGCVLFVKLRQFPGRARMHIALATPNLAWEPSAMPGVETKPLYAQAGFSDSTRLERWAAGTSLGRVSYLNGAEIFVIEGAFEDEKGRFGAGTWLRFPVRSLHAPSTTSGCVLYIKEGGFAYLQDQET